MAAIQRNRCYVCDKGVAFGNNAVYQVRSDIDGKLTAKLVAS